MKSEMRIVFMGTPAFAVPALRALHETSLVKQWRIVAVVSQPDRRAGRGKKLSISPVKEYAVQQGIPMLQPSRLRNRPEAIEQLRGLDPDLLVVAAYGLILPPAVLDLPRFGAINIHASLLPAYRGASPVAAAILDGLETTGITLMLMDEGMDTGPALRQATQPIRPDDTTEALSARLAEQGAHLLVETLPAWLGGDVAPVDQADLPGEPSVCRLIRKQDGRVDWQSSAQHIERMTRAYAPWPSAHTSWRGENFKIVRARVVAGQAEPGLVVASEQGPAVGTGEGLLLLQSVQPAGKRAMDIRGFLNGVPEFVGTRLGE